MHALNFVYILNLITVCFNNKLLLKNLIPNDLFSLVYSYFVQFFSHVIKKIKTIKSKMLKLSLNELASEGERLCKLGDCQNGVKYFEEALKLYDQLKNDANLDEKEQNRLLHVMSVIYNQMGNAFFNMQDFAQALEYHKKDLELSELFEDESGKAKACGNVGNTLQMMGEHDEAILYLLRNLEISKKLNDLVILFNNHK